ncbi:hypothetical protein AWC38_SpisGene19439 [Stylophora pistillata]|uniref:Uncharacterized protein n=1 Tax=Stylophora pistillata TaxID=50429 RepID=A0A2B4RIV5_STYPI|nr:hypothetical protein AWC38_SpisGene19439 [Stylophora pistillata]
MDGELQRKSVTFENDLQMDDVLGEFGIRKDLPVFKSNETSPESSPLAISPLNTIEDTEVEENVRTEIRKRIPTGKAREFEVQIFKDNRRKALPPTSPTLRPRRGRWKWVMPANRALVKLAKKQHNDGEISSVRSRLSSRCKRSANSSCSSKTKLMEAKAKAASLEIKAAFLKERQALRMATEELEFRQEITQAKVEEELYEQFEMEQNIDDMDDYLEKMKVQSTSTPISSQAISSTQVKLLVASASNSISKDQQGPAVVNSVTTAPKVTPSITPISSSPAFTTSSMNPSAQPFISENLFTKPEEPAVSVVPKHLYNPQRTPHSSRRNSSPVFNESTYQEFINVQKKKQTEL